MDRLRTAAVSNDLSVCSHRQMMHIALSSDKCHLHQVRHYGRAVSTPADRLKQARAEAGHDSAKAAAEAMGVSVATYIQHENGTRGLPSGKADRYARFFRTTPEWLLYGRRSRSEPSGQLVPVVGKVGADPEGRILFATGQDSGDLAPVPPGGTLKASAVEVAGHSMPGFADDGALIYFEEQHTTPTRDHIGKVVIVELEGGEVLVKRMLRGDEPGLWDLESIAGPTRNNVRIRWVANITAIIPPPHSQRIIVRAGTLGAA